MNTRPSCGNCKFHSLFRDCRRHAPSVAVDPKDGALRTLWPEVSDTNFCGDHEWDEEMAKAQIETAWKQVKESLLRDPMVAALLSHLDVTKKI